MKAPSSEPREGVGSYLTPGSFIAAARKADPNFKYAIIAAGLLAIVAIFAKFGVSFATLLFGSIALVGLMVLFLVFAQIRKLRRSALDVPARVLVWTILLVVLTIAFMLTTSAFFNWPLPFRDSIVRSLDAGPGTSSESGTGTANTTETAEQAKATATPAASETPIDPATRVLLVQDVTEAYKRVGWQIAFINNWGQPPTRQRLRVQSMQLVGTAADGRVVSTNIDPNLLPVPQYYSAQTIDRIGAGPHAKCPRSSRVIHSTRPRSAG